MNNKVVIIGCGNVGMSYAYALLNQRTYVNKLILIDINKERVLGEVMDLNHGLPYAPSKISINSGTYSDCSDAKIVVIAAGVNQKPGETRLDLINKNSSIFKDIISNVMASGFNGIFLVATNPVDILTYMTWKYSNLDCSRVIGTGTSLDTARLQLMIGKKLCINPKNIQGYVLGEHGDSEFIPWSHANISLQNIKEFLNENELNEIELNVKNSAYEIINKKGATYYGIGMALVRITNAILGNENLIMPLSIYDKENDVYIGRPCIVGNNGVKNINLKLTEEENSKYMNSVNIIKEEIAKIKI